MDKASILHFTAIFIIVLRRILTYAIVARMIISWFTMGQGGMSDNKIIQFLHAITDPVINFFRRFPHKIGMFDLAPLIALLALDFGSQFLLLLLAKLV
ncbi:MAG: YggT family protein [Patescibacteria group bacterium]